MPRSKEGVKRLAVDGPLVEKAVHLVVQQKLSVREAATATGVQKSTIHRHVKKFIASGKETYAFNSGLEVWKVFDVVQEAMLKDYILHSAKIYHGVTVDGIKALAYSFAKAIALRYPTSWDVKQRAGKSWYAHFMSRHGDQISLRTPQATSLGRAMCFNRHTVGEFFKNLKGVISRQKFGPTRIFNVDESGVTTVHVPKKVLAPKGVKQVNKVTSQERGNLVTVICTISASGASIPPHFIFPRKKLPQRTMNGAPPGSIGLVNKSGWSNAEAFFKYLQSFAREINVSPENPALLLLDNHESHLSIDVIEFAKKNGIEMLTFPHHCSHKLQPLDRSVFGPLKKFYNTACDEFMLMNPCVPISIHDVAALVGKAYPLAFTPNNIMSGFRCTGIWPLNENIFSDDDFLGSEVSNQPPPDEHAVIPAIVVSAPAPDAQNELKDPSSEPQSSTSADPTSTVISPEDVRPFPKSVRKATTKGRKRGRTTHLTSTPELRALKEAKIAREEKKNKPPKSAKINKTKRVLFQVDTDDEQLNLSDVQTSSASEDDFNMLSDDGTEELEDLWPLGVGDFCIGKVAGKKSMHNYVCKVVGEEKGGLVVVYLKKSNLKNKFFIPDNAEEYVLLHGEVVLKLPTPKVAGSSERQSRLLDFHVDFSNFNIK